jgi:hypothetical protein
MEGEYNQRLSAVQSEITGIKSDVKNELEAKQREKEAYEWELGKLETRYKVGEMPMEEYLSADKKLRADARALEAECKELNRIIEASSAAELPVAAGKPQVTAPEPPSPPAETKPAKPTKPVHEKRQEPATPTRINVSGGKFNLPQVNLPAVAGGVLLMISVFLPWIAASEILGTDLGSDSGREISGLLAAAGIGGGLIVIGASFLPSLKLRWILHAVIGLIALGVLVYCVFSGLLPIHNEYARTLIVIREGLYLYIILAIAIIIISLLERRGISYILA